MHGPSLVPAVAVLLPLLALSACGERTVASDASAPPSAASGIASPAADASRDPCGLLTIAEVEAVLGPLAGPPFRATNGAANVAGESCRFETSTYRAIDLHVRWSDGSRELGIRNLAKGVVSKGGLKGALQISDGTTLTGEWDEAQVIQCCQLAALRGDRLVTIDVSGSRATIEQAARLADAALRRLPRPLTVDPAAGHASARARAAARPRPRPVCELVTRADAEAITRTRLLADPVGDDHSCTFAWALPDLADARHQLTLRVSWRGGFSHMRLAQSALGQGFAFLGSGGLDPDREHHPASESLDDMATNLVGVMAAEKDVLLTVETGGFMNDLAQAFVERAGRRL